MSATPAVVGIDLSLRRTAVADVAGRTHLIPTPAVSDDDAQGQMERIDVIATSVTALLIPAGGPELVVIEGYSFGSSTKGVRSMAELGGNVRRSLWRLGIPYLDVPPKTVKKYATGNGNAGKYEVIQAASKRLGYDGHDDNEADALWLRAIGAFLLGAPLVRMAKPNEAALDALYRQAPVLAGARTH